MTAPYPLQWPDDWPRTPRHRQVRSKFKSTLGAARDDLVSELRRLKARHVVISTNWAVRLDGLLYANCAEHNDAGVAAYFHWRGKPHVIACDSYIRVWENVRAVAKTIEALRTIERHGASQLLERAVSGFSALPPAGASDEPPPVPWWTVLGVGAIDGADPIQIAGDPTHHLRAIVLKLAEGIYRTKIRDAHPDRPGGSAARGRELNAAIEQARRVLA